MEKSVKWNTLSQIEEALITPTPLALELFARCHGHRGEIAEFYGVSTCANALSAAD